MHFLNIAAILWYHGLINYSTNDLPWILHVPNVQNFFQNLFQEIFSEFISRVIFIQLPKKLCAEMADALPLYSYIQLCTIRLKFAISVLLVLLLEDS